MSEPASTIRMAEILRFVERTEEGDDYRADLVYLLEHIAVVQQQHQQAKQIIREYKSGVANLKAGVANLHGVIAIEQQQREAAEARVRALETALREIRDRMLSSVQPTVATMIKQAAEAALTASSTPIPEQRNTSTVDNITSI